MLMFEINKKIHIIGIIIVYAITAFFSCVYGFYLLRAISEPHDLIHKLTQILLLIFLMFSVINFFKFFILVTSEYYKSEEKKIIKMNMICVLIWLIMFGIMILNIYWKTRNYENSKENLLGILIIFIVFIAPIFYILRFLYNLFKSPLNISKIL